MTTQLDVSCNEMLEEVFDAAVAANQKLSSARTQVDMLRLCSGNGEVRDLLIYLADINNVPLKSIIGAIKFVDRRLALRLCCMQSDRHKNHLAENAAFVIS